MLRPKIDFRSLSRQDIQVLVGFGCPSADRKVVFSAKLLRKYVHLDEGDVSLLLNLLMTLIFCFSLSNNHLGVSCLVHIVAVFSIILLPAILCYVLVNVSSNDISWWLFAPSVIRYQLLFLYVILCLLIYSNDIFRNFLHMYNYFRMFSLVLVILPCAKSISLCRFLLNSIFYDDIHSFIRFVVPAV